ncbi:MAG: FhaA domain-containing protein [Thermacetogeniaceae bacterium]|mgnify:CR=1 FL=1|jgi:hypothetical protein|nr:DUF3662 and FHA domain-containing protein [Thermoanaerobacterales bacterium]NLN21335.1 DUF3662 domain-containing protein [Syntrophomonadaceae bacterium]HAF17773.1 DUF2662 domain-containing protein [Peptococcaceae bacterium]
MNLEELENMLTKFWEGIFRKGKRPIQPVEIARALVREMAAHRRVSVSRVYAPNIFTISLSKADFQQSSSLQEALCRELADYVRNKAVEKEYTLIGRPQVAFMEDETLEMGEITVKSAYSSDLHQEQVEPNEAPGIDHTMIFDKHDKLNEAVGKNYIVTIVSGPDQGKSITIKRDASYYIGRKSTNHLVLTDINASRDHAYLELRNGVLHIVDLGSRNGTYVDGIRVEQYELEDGDQFQIGDNLFRIERG